jgi:predicted small integral membrane protein
MRIEGYSSVMNKKIWICGAIVVAILALTIIAIVFLANNISDFNSEIEFYNRAIVEDPSHKEMYEEAIKNWERFASYSYVALTTIVLTVTVALSLLGHKIYALATTQEYRDAKRVKKAEQAKNAKEAKKARLQSELDKLNN